MHSLPDRLLDRPGPASRQRPAQNRPSGGPRPVPLARQDGGPPPTQAHAARSHAPTPRPVLLRGAPHRPPWPAGRAGLLLRAGLAGFGSPGGCGRPRHKPAGRQRQGHRRQDPGQAPRRHAGVAPGRQPAPAAAQRGPGPGAGQRHRRGHQRRAARDRCPGAHRPGGLRIQAVDPGAGADRQAGAVHAGPPGPALRDGPARNQHRCRAPGRPCGRRGVAADPGQVDADEHPAGPAHGRQLPACRATRGGGGGGHIAGHRAGHCRRAGRRPRRGATGHSAGPG